jgi:hypothetical protein
MPTSFHGALFFVTALALATIAGCGSSSSPGSFKPDGDAARQALEKSLAAWKSGQKTDSLGALASEGPKVQVVDSDWTGGKRLASYEITAEAPDASETAHQFSVKLQYEKAKQPVEAVYHVVGKDPILVFRDKDYEQSRGM